MAFDLSFENSIVRKGATYLSFCLLLLSASCKAESVRHEPAIAVINGNQFLKALHIDEDYEKARGLADTQLQESVTANDLRQLVEKIKTERGALKTLKADSYLMVQGRGMELFYLGTYDRGQLYHRLVVVGDASSGYEVSGVWYSTDAYPEQPLRRKFGQEIFVQ